MQDSAQQRLEEFHHKRQLVTQYLARHQLDAVILTRRINFAWLSAGGSNHVNLATDSGAASLLVTADRVLCLTNRIEADRVLAEELAGLGVEVRASEWFDGTTAAAAWRDALGSARAVACDMRVGGLPDTVGSLKSTFDTLRWTLSSWEIDRLRLLCKETASVAESACRQVRRNDSEFHLAAAITSGLLDKGIRAPVMLIAADERARRYRHPIPTQTRFTKYGMAVVGAERGGLIASCSRLFSFGPISSDLRRRHEAVCQIDAAMIGTTRPGRTLGEIFDVAQRMYAGHGFADEWKLHHQGGPTGYTARDAKASPANSTAVLTDQAYAWNPSIAGTKSEDTMLVTANGNEILTRTGQWPCTTYTGGGRGWERCNILPM